MVGLAQQRQNNFSVSLLLQLIRHKGGHLIYIYFLFLFIYIYIYTYIYICMCIYIYMHFIRQQ